MLHYPVWKRLAFAVSFILLVMMSLPLTMVPQAAFARSSTASINPHHSSTSTQSANVVVSSDGVWQDTGITVNVGDTLKVSATGSWSADPNDGSTGPDGYTQESPDNFLNLTDIGVCSVCATTQTPHWGALIGYVGSAPPSAGSYTSTSILPEAQKVFVVGSNFQTNAQLAGELWLNFNDDAYSANTGDNTGQVTATVSVKGQSLPGGTWISPANGFTVQQGTTLHYQEHAYPTNPGDPAIDHVNFTAWWPGLNSTQWYIPCTAYFPAPGTSDVYTCDWPLTDANGHPVVRGQLEVSFDVYDVNGGVNFAPNGVHSGTITMPTIQNEKNFIWGGYVTKYNGSNLYSEVKGSWTVKAVTCYNKGKPITGTAAFWVGLGGFNYKYLEQTGTAADCVKNNPNNPHYWVWYEMVGTNLNNGNPIDLKKPIKVGDQIFAEVAFLGNGQYSILLQNMTEPWTVHLFPKSPGLPNSAEWIAEQDGAPASLPNFGMVTFFGCYVDYNQPITASPLIYNEQVWSVGNNSYVKPIKITAQVIIPDGTGFNAVWNNY